MRSDTSRLPLVLAAFIGGLALFVAGFFIAAEMRSATASPAAASTGGACYTNWNANTCAAGYTAVSTGEWTHQIGYIGGYLASGGVVCASPKTEGPSGSYAFASSTDSGYGHIVSHEPCATCCAVTASAVGGIANLPPMAGIDGSSGYNYAIAALLAFVAVVAFAAGGWYARRRWLG